MPQFDFSNFSPQLVWLVITFGLLYFVMARYALPRVGEILEERQNRIDVDLEKAEKLKSESEKLEENYEALTVAARAQASTFLKTERDRIQANIDEKRAQLKSKTEKKIAEAERNIADAKSKAMLDVESIAAQACQVIVSQLSGQKLTAQAAKKAIQIQSGQIQSSQTQSGKAS